MATPSWGTYFSKSVWLKVLPKCSLITSGGDSPHGEPKTQPTPNMHIREHVEKEWAEGGGWGAGGLVPGGTRGGITLIKQRAADLITRLGNTQEKTSGYDVLFLSF